jgi:signal transduction histidine kinase
MREPLRLMVSYSQLLLRRREGSSDPVEREYAEHLRASADRMRGLIDGLLIYSRAAHDSADAPTRSDAAAVAQEAVRLFADVIQESGATVVIDRLPAVAIGATPLLQLFQNLIGNALKYRRAGEQPKIHISAVEAGGEVCFAVRDNGIGIEPEYHDQIFGLFRRLHGSEYPGLGVGLASCKRVAEHCGGRIWLESKPGAGSTFYVALPAVEAASRSAARGSGA